MPIAPATRMALSKDGRLELFAVGSPSPASGDAAVWHLYQVRAGEGWSNWTDHGTPPAPQQNHSGPVVAPNSEGRLEMFFVNSGVLWHQWQVVPNGGWSGWTSHGTPDGVVVGRPMLGRHGDGSLEVLVTGSDGALWAQYQTRPCAGWSDWVTRGRPNSGISAGSGITVGTSAGRRLEVFVVGDDGNLWRTQRAADTDDWTSWVSHGRPPGVTPRPLAQPAIASSADGRLEVFIAGDDGAIWQIYQLRSGGDWSNGVSHGAPPGLALDNTGPAVAASADGRLEMFSIGPDGALWHKNQLEPNSGWSGWYSHGRPPAGSWPVSLWERRPIAALNSHGRLEVFAAGTDSAMWHIWQTRPNNGWSPWTSHGTPPGYIFFG